MTFLLVNADGDLELEIRDTGWMGHGNCASGGHGRDFFVEETSSGDDTGTVRECKRECATCPVRIECMVWAFDMERNEEFRSGIYGGLTGAERMMATQAADPVAYGLKVLDDQVRVGLVLLHVTRWKEKQHGATAQRGAE